MIKKQKQQTETLKREISGVALMSNRGQNTNKINKHYKNNK